MDPLDDGEDVPQLPADTLKLLDEFATEKNAAANKFKDLKLQSEGDYAGRLSMEAFRASQFWYTDKTARTLAEQLLHGASTETSIAVVSAPSVYLALRNILRDEPVTARPMVKLLEYDRRFEVFGADFVYYDLEHPLRLPAELKSQFDRIICDPPFLSEDCQTKTALTVRYLAKSWVAVHDTFDGLRLISCTGERVGEIIGRLYGKIGVKTTTFEPEHSKGLSNEFRCYANFECPAWAWR
ncbi:hypothetical protein B0A55_01807 [Friedmanniomyces simplex]|uniref:Protein-lysine N-methyltransferase EFM5 n=1 Tax=Friedmanniomyces simplex TaxID=329884 RepID=A0A4U0XW90_9PEZI|nr:hypothetical protein B0A55_01807 [Friedmanniomyces simplex]